MYAVAAYDLTKQYATVTALERLNLQIPEGSAFGCVGRRGSGKTTLIRLLSGLCRPTAGECSVLGFSPFFEGDRLHALAGTVLGSAQLYLDMTLSENLRFFAGLNGLDENDTIDRSSFLLHGLDIWEGRDEKIDDLPTGVAYRSSIARALIHRPRLLLLDEPAGGMDRETAESIRSLLQELVTQEGMTLLLSTENMEYAQSLCKTFGLLENGFLLAKGDFESLRQGAGVRYRVVLRLGENYQAPGGFLLREDGQWQKEIASEEELTKITAQIVRNGIPLYEARLVRPTLEEIYDAVLAGGIQRAGDENEQGSQSESIGDQESDPRQQHRQPPEPEEAGNSDGIA